MKAALSILFLLLSTHVYSLQAIFPDSCNTILWGIVNAKGDTSYLLGTFHEFGNVFFDSHSPLRSVYRSAECIATENDMRPIRIAKNETIKLSRSDRQSLEKYLGKTHSALTMKSTRYLPPASISYFLLHELYIRVCNTHEAEDVAVMDEYIANGARTAGKKLVGLESSADVLSVFNKMAGTNDNYDIKGIESLRDIIANPDKYVDSARKQCWEADNYKALTINYHFSKHSTEDDTLYAEIIDKRNYTWMDTIPQLLEDNRTFIAVGLKHLFYKNGLIMLLSAKGYTLFPVTLTKIENFHYKKALKK
ncbi:MAG: hypothetical protein JWQ38_1349 [Flavipsychrobacter sp.]|nr:hypothetical protein [Flavipsychrobacter sp.]